MSDRIGEKLALSIVSPCYNEEGCIDELYRRLQATAAALVGDSFEIILVNDGSKDKTLEKLRHLTLTKENVVVINLSRNFGHENALTAGLLRAEGQRVFIVDADLQDPPELLKDMMLMMDAGADVVYGRRRSRLGETKLKMISARFFYRMLERLIEIKIPLDTGDFRLMNRKTVDVFKTFPEEFRFVRGLLSWIGGNQVALFYDRSPRYAGESAYPLTKLVRFGLDAVTGFSILPLRIASYLGFLMGLMSAAMLIYAFYGWIKGEAVAGWTSLSCFVLTIGSVQLLVLGIFGEYLGRLYIESKRRPLFVISDILISKVTEPVT